MLAVGFQNQLKHDGVYKDGFMGMLGACQEIEPLPAFKLTNDLGEILHVRARGRISSKTTSQGSCWIRSWWQLPEPRSSSTSSHLASGR